MILTLIGYWKSELDPNLPDPTELSGGLSGDDVESVSDYLKRGHVARAFMGKSRCRVCGKEVGSLELSDGTFIWPEGLSHYVDVHHVKLPSEFLDHVYRRTTELEDAEVDQSWWRSQ